MIPFSELQRLADKCKKKTGLSCMVSLEYWSWSDDIGGSDLKYGLHIANSTVHQKFDTVQEFKTGVANILNPPKDTGVKISTKKEVNNVNNSQ